MCGVGMQGNQKQGVLCIVWQVQGSSTCTDTLVRSLCEAAMFGGWGCRQGIATGCVLCGRLRIQNSSTCTDTLVRSLCEAAMCGLGVQVG